MTTNMSLKKVLIGIVSAAVILAGAAFYLFSPTQYLALDVNPSIELQTNRMGRVVSMVGVNEDARALLANYEADGQKLDAVLEQLVNRMIESGYIAEGKVNDILITSEKGSTTDQALLEIREKVEKELAKHQLSGEIVTQSIARNEEMDKQAAEYQVSAGKMAMIEKLLTSQDVSLTAEDLANTRISDLLTYAKTNHISLDTLEDHLEALQKTGGDNAHLEDLEEAVDDAKDAVKDEEEALKDAEEDAKDAREEAEEEAAEAAEEAKEQAKEEAEKAADAVKEAKEEAEEAEEKAADAIKEAAEAAKDAEEEAKDLAEEKAEKAEEAAREAADQAKAKQAKEVKTKEVKVPAQTREVENDADADADTDTNDSPEVDD